MAGPLKKDEISALVELRKSRQTGISPPAMPAPVVGRLASHRYVRPDEYGGVQITERGEMYLRDLPLSKLGRYRHGPARSR